uniref:Uncharacterized protein n=1 Tax=Avena sativa TaxID=4498 RepID=A0ACD5Z3Q2_AVESA
MSLSPTLEESYAKLNLGQRWRRPKGFRLFPRKCRLSVRRLRAKLLAFLGLVGRHARQLGRRLSTSSTTGSSPPGPRSGSSRALAGQRRYCSKGGEADKAPRRATSFMRTNSFYAQAIADCLEFIKRNSVPVNDYGRQPHRCRGRHREIDLV